MHKICFRSIYVVLLLHLITLIPGAQAETSGTLIYVDQAAGVNSQSTSGKDDDPFKSITYAFLTMKNREAQDPWTVHIRKGLYDAAPEKATNAREVFPIELRESMRILGDDGTENCIIDATYNSDPTNASAILRAENVHGLEIRGITLQKMTRTAGTGNGGACELINCSGVIQNCFFRNNRVSDEPSSAGGAIYLDVASGEKFLIKNNTLKSNSCSALNAYGGAVCITEDSIADIIDNTFISNSVSAYIYDNHASAGGGGVCAMGRFFGCTSGNVFYRNSCTSRAYFDKLRSYAFGGAIHVSNELSGSISENIFVHNSAVAKHNAPDSSWTRAKGGAVFLAAVKAGEVDANFFLGNRTGDYGGTWHMGPGYGGPCLWVPDRNIESLL